VKSYNLEFLSSLSRSESDWLTGYFEGLGFAKEIFKSQTTCRDLLWFGRGISDYDTPFPKPIVAREIHPFLATLGDRFYPEADSILVYRYRRGGSISEHRDKGCERTAVMINLFDCPRDLLGEKRFFQDFRWGGNTYSLADGDVIAFDSWVRHEAKPAPVPRYSITFRKLVEEGRYV
jgi:alkylated DNA repair dioxygenase AlkB